MRMPSWHNQCSENPQRNSAACKTPKVRRPPNLKWSRKCRSESRRRWQSVRFATKVTPRTLSSTKSTAKTSSSLWHPIFPRPSKSAFSRFLLRMTKTADLIIKIFIKRLAKTKNVWLISRTTGRSYSRRRLWTVSSLGRWCQSGSRARRRKPCRARKTVVDRPWKGLMPRWCNLLRKVASIGNQTMARR